MTADALQYLAPHKIFVNTSLMIFQSSFKSAEQVGGEHVTFLKKQYTFAKWWANIEDECPVEVTCLIVFVKV